MAVRASSTIEEVSIGPAKELYRRYRRLGIYEWEDVLETAGGDPRGEVMAFRFGGTELFRWPVTFERLQELLNARNGIGNPLASPVAIGTDLFFDIFCEGTRRRRLDA
jgi:hypothetical protein